MTRDEYVTRRTSILAVMRQFRQRFREMSDDPENIPFLLRDAVRYSRCQKMLWDLRIERRVS